jgi:hypothetical protein
MESNLEDVLINHRDNLINYLEANGSYSKLKIELEKINSGESVRGIIEPTNKFVRRILSNGYIGAKYRNTAISWLPSIELVDDIHKIINRYSIKTIEEISAGLGILSALLKKRSTNPELDIIASDVIDKSNMSENLDYVPIAKRSITDFKYYSQVNFPLPEMIITYKTGYTNDPTESISNFHDEFFRLIHSKQHKIIIICHPDTDHDFYEPLSMISNNLNIYHIESHHVKAFNSYFFVSKLFDKYYPTNMIIHVLIRSDIYDGIPISAIMTDSIVQVKMLDTNCFAKRQMEKISDVVSDKLVKSIMMESDFFLGMASNKIFCAIRDNLMELQKTNIKHIPEYIYKSDEFIIWSTAITDHSIYMKHDDRYQFISFILPYQSSLTESDSTTDLPQWVRTVDSKIMYFYAKSIDLQGNFNTKRNFMVSFKKKNLENKKYFMQNSVDN